MSLQLFMIHRNGWAKDSSSITTSSSWYFFVTRTLISEDHLWKFMKLFGMFVNNTLAIVTVISNIRILFRYKLQILPFLRIMSMEYSTCFYVPDPFRKFMLAACFSTTCSRTKETKKTLRLRLSKKWHLKRLRKRTKYNTSEFDRTHW